MMQKWLPQMGRLAGKTEEVRALNAYLDAVEHRIYEIHKELIAGDREISGEIIKLKYAGISERPRMLVEIYQYHNEQIASLVGKEFAIGTI